MQSGVEQAAEKAIRVVVANQPRLMRELVLETIASQPDIEIVGEVQNETNIAGVVQNMQPDFLIIELTESGEPLPLYAELLQLFPRMRILALSPEGDSSIFYWASLHIHAKRVEASEDGVLSALRDQAPLDRGQP
jgi:chemotaxis response regulator CheB